MEFDLLGGCVPGSSQASVRDSCRGRGLAPSPASAPVARRPSPGERERERVAGYYAFASPRIELVGFVDRLVGGIETVDYGGELLARPLRGGEVRLVRTGVDSYRLPRESGTSARFATTEDGTDILLVGSAYFERARLGPARARIRIVGAGLRAMAGGIAAFVVVMLLWLASPLFGRLVRPADVWLLAAPAASAACLFSAEAVLATASVDALASPTGTSVAICLLTLAHAGLAGAGLGLSASLLIRRQLDPAIAWLPACLSAVAMSLVCAGFAGWLAATASSVCAPGRGDSVRAGTRRSAAGHSGDRPSSRD